MTALHAVDLYAGPGGWDVGARALGMVTVGVEIDDSACATRRAAGLPTLQRSVLDVDPRPFAPFGLGLIASPPCQTFSTAGKGSGRKALDEVLLAVKRIGADPDADPFADLSIEDERTKHVVEPLRWALLGGFTWLAWEQVPTVLPVWQACAEVLVEHGWHVATGNVSAEQYGVPQTRRRAVLLARKDRPVELPAPTHSKYHSRDRERLDDGVLPWVSMARALGWGMTERPYPTVAVGAGAGGADPQAVGGSGARRVIRSEIDAGRWQRYGVVRQSGRAGAAKDHSTDSPSPTITDKGTVMVFERELGDVVSSNGTVRHESHSAPTVTSSMDNGNFRVREAFTAEGQEQTYAADVADDKPWTRERPATTIATRDLVPDPGANANRFNGATKPRNDGVRVTVEQAATLQSFPPDHPWQGTKTKRFEQVGNAIPPLLALHLLAAVTGREDRVEAAQRYSEAVMP